jgi:hypothetical protein
MVMIAARGIDPETTPTARKRTMLKSMLIIGLILFFLFFLATLFYRLPSLGIPTWGLHIITMMVIMAWHFEVCWVCRVRQNMAMSYFEDKDAYVVPEGNDLVPWKSGRELPEMPKKGYKSGVIHNADMENEGIPPTIHAESDK